MKSQNTITTVAFLVSWPITSEDVGRFGLNSYMHKGFEVKVFDLSKLVNRSELALYPVRNEITAPFITKFDSFTAFERSIQALSSSTIFIDWICLFSDISLKYERIFRILKRRRARYFVLYPVALPVTSTISQVSVVGKLKVKILQVNNVEQLVDFCIRKILIFARRRLGLYALPERIFTSSYDVAESFLSKYGLSPMCVVLVHSFDYNTYLESVGNSLKLVSEPSICVFLEEGLTDHCDWAISGIAPLDKEAYITVINGLFSAIEQRTNLKVVIAAHPRTNLNNINDLFIGRPIIQGRTCELVRKSSMVVGHYSTAMNFAVLADKPVLLVKTYEMGQRTIFNNMVDNMADALGLTPICLDNSTQIPDWVFDYERYPRDRYQNYLHKYVKSKNLPDMSVADIVVREIVKMNKQPRVTVG